MEEITEAELRTAIGPRSDYYFAQWHGTARRTLNWAAFGLAALWLPFRRMYGVTTLFYGAIFVQMVLQETIFSRLGYAEVPRGVEKLSQFVFPVICGALGNGWYIGHLRRLITATQDLALPEEEHLKVLSMRGGTRAWHAIGFFASFIIAILAVQAGLVLPTTRWLLEGGALYAPIVVISFAGRRPIATVPRLIAAAWIVAAVRCLPVACGTVRHMWAGDARPLRGVLSWPAASVWIILLLVPAAALLIWRGRDHLGSLLFVLVAANWVFLEVFGMQLATLKWPLWTWGLPLLSLLTIGVLGPYALWKSMHAPEHSI